MSDVTAQATIQHGLTMTTPDDPLAENRPSHWNATHAASVVMAASAVFGVFSNANAFSFGTSDAGGGNTVITGSYTVPFVPGQSVQTQPAGNIAGAGFTSTTTAGVDVKGTHDSVGLSLAVPAYITTYAAQSVQTQAAGDIARSGFTTTTIAGDVVAGTLNTDGLKLAVPAYLTAAGGGGLTNIKVSAGTLSAHRSDITFNNSNGMSFGLETNGIITGTVKTDYLTTARASTDAIGLNTAQTNVTWTVNSSGLSFNAGGYAGTSTGFAGANISGSITHDTLGINLSFSVAAPGGGAGNTVYSYEPPPGAATAMSSLSFQTNTSGAMSLWPVQVFQNVAAEYMDILASMNFNSNTGSSRYTETGQLGWGLFTRPEGANSTRLSAWKTGSLGWTVARSASTFSFSQATITNSTGYGTALTSSAGVNITSQYTGMKQIGLYLGTTLTPGQYWFGLHFRRSTSSVNAGIGQSLSLMCHSMATALTALAPIGSLSSNQSTGTKVPLQEGGNWYVANGSYSVAGMTTLTTDITLSQVTQNVLMFPFIRFVSRRT